MILDKGSDKIQNLRKNIWATFQSDLSFKCRRCGHSCYCTSVPVLVSEASLIQDTADQKDIIISGRIHDSITGYCPFFVQKTPSCNNYDLRPFACRQYPFIISRTKNSYIIDITYSCSSIILDNHLEPASFEQNQSTLFHTLISDMPKDYPFAELELEKYRKVAMNLKARFMSLINPINTDMNSLIKNLTSSAFNDPCDWKSISSFIHRLLYQLTKYKDAHLRSINLNKNGTSLFDIYIYDNTISSTRTEHKAIPANQDLAALSKDATILFCSYCNHIIQRYCTLNKLSKVSASSSDLVFLAEQYFSSSILKILYLCNVFANLDKHEIITETHLKSAIFTLDSAITIPDTNPNIL